MLACTRRAASSNALSRSLHCLIPGKRVSVLAAERMCVAAMLCSLAMMHWYRVTHLQSRRGSCIANNAVKDCLRAPGRISQQVRIYAGVVCRTLHKSEQSQMSIIIFATAAFGVLSSCCLSVAECDGESTSQLPPFALPVKMSTDLETRTRDLARYWEKAYGVVEMGPD